MYKETFKEGRKSFVRLQCDGCGKEFIKSVRAVHANRRLPGLRHFCTQSCMGGEFNGNWRGGESTHIKGYSIVRKDGKPILQHRMVMEEALGRPLFPCETVHHKDGNRKNNKLENLQLLVVSEHPYGIETQHLEDINRLLHENRQLRVENKRLKEL